MKAQMLSNIYRDAKHDPNQNPICMLTFLAHKYKSAFVSQTCIIFIDYSIHNAVLQALLTIHQSQFYHGDNTKRLPKMALSCEARVKLTLSLGLIILVVVCAVITVVVLKATTDDPDASSKLDSNVTTTATVTNTTNQNHSVWKLLKISYLNFDIFQQFLTYQNWPVC